MTGQLEFNEPDPSLHAPRFGQLAIDGLDLQREKAQTKRRLPDEQLTAERIEVFRRMPPMRRLALAEQLDWAALEHWLSRRGLEPVWQDVQTSS